MDFIDIQPLSDASNSHQSLRTPFRVSSSFSKPEINRECPSDIFPLAEEEIRWYLEDFADKDPSNASRAEATNSILGSYGRVLESSLLTTYSSRRDDDTKHLIVRVKGCPGSPAENILWESLEHVQETGQPRLAQHHFTAVVRVSHGLAVSCPPHAAEKSSTSIHDPANILVVVARPNSGQDVPHRLVSRIILEVLSTIPKASRPVNLEIVRPGTFEALEEHLHVKSPGYFDLVHLDLHGYEDSTAKEFVTFLKASEKDLAQPHHVCAAELGDLLRRYDVKRAVLNACRSAKGETPETNFAQGLVNAGVPFVVAMSYNVSATAVEIFTKVFYTCFIHCEMTMLSATWGARYALYELPRRKSKFGTYVNVSDWVVPRLYSSKVEDDELQLNNLEGYLSTLERMHLTPGSEKPLGRENDILSLESNLLLSGKPVLLSGPAAVGKTYLMRHLEGWWKLTGLIQGHLHVDLSTKTLSLANLFKLIPKSFSKDQNIDFETAIQALRNERYLLILDGIESIQTTDEWPLSRQRSELRKLLKGLRGGRTLVVLISRNEENWLGAISVQQHLAGLQTIPGVQFIRTTEDPGNESASLGSWNSEEDFIFLDQIVRLVDGNPLVLKILSQDFRKVSISPAQYYFRLLQGAPISINSTSLVEELEGVRNFFELDQIIEDLFHNKHVLPQTLALFWKTIPYEDFPVFLQFFNIQSTELIPKTGPELMEYSKLVAKGRKNLGPMGEKLQKLVEDLDRKKASTLPEFLPATKNLVSQEALYCLSRGAYPDYEVFQPIQKINEEWRDTIFQPLIARGYLRYLEPFDSSTESPKKYLQVHPLLLIALRFRADWTDRVPIAEFCRQAFPAFYGYRSKTWPVDKMYFNKAWDEPRAELELDFTNFATAALLVTHRRTKDLALRDQMLKVNMLFHRGVGNDPIRYLIVRYIWSNTINTCLDDEKECKQQLRKQNTLARSFKHALHLEKHEEVNLTAARLFQSLGCAFAIASRMMIFLAHNSDDARFSLLKLMKRIAHDMKHILGDVGFSSADQAFYKRHLEYGIEMAVMWSNLLDSDEKEIFKLREKTMRDSIKHYNVEEYPEEQNSWEALGALHLNEKMETFALNSTMLAYIPQIQSALAAGEYEVGRLLVDDALVAEENSENAGNDLKNRANLLRYRSIINQKQLKMADAERDMHDALLLESRITGSSKG
ncbi:hypothetical protein B0J14DRAFT_643340 [Halenospora varia]|nr:hypothetical protein B0J14DRAFT_643340 [Halenospora varia]